MYVISFKRHHTHYRAKSQQQFQYKVGRFYDMEATWYHKAKLPISQSQLTSYNVMTRYDTKSEAVKVRSLTTFEQQGQ